MWLRVALYLLLGLGNLILVVRMRRALPKWSPPDPSLGTVPTAKRTGPYDPQPPQPPQGLMDLWKIAPLVNVLVTCGLLAI